MDLSKLLQMIINTLLRRVVSKGIDAGINRMAGGAARPQKAPLTEQERLARDMAKRARQAAKLTRKL